MKDYYPLPQICETLRCTWWKFLTRSGYFQCDVIRQDDVCTLKVKFNVLHELCIVLCRKCLNVSWKKKSLKKSYFKSRILDRRSRYNGEKKQNKTTNNQKQNTTLSSTNPFRNVRDTDISSLYPFHDGDRKAFVKTSS